MYTNTWVLYDHFTKMGLLYEFLWLYINQIYLESLIKSDCLNAT